MKKKLIQLSPFNPPYYPLLNVLNRLAGEGFTPIGKNEFKILNQRLTDFISLQKYQIVDIIIQVHHSITEEELMSWLVIQEDFNKILEADHDIIDISGFPPYLTELNSLKAKRIIYSFNSFIGLDREIKIIFERSDQQTRTHMELFENLDNNQIHSLKLLDLLIIDFDGHKELIKRDLLYKSFLIRNLIDNRPNLVYYFIPDEKYPSTLFSFKILDTDPQNFLDQMLYKGIELGHIKNKNGDYVFLIANYIQHSKEQIEKFVDSVNEILI